MQKNAHLHKIVQVIHRLQANNSVSRDLGATQIFIYTYVYYILCSK